MADTDQIRQIADQYDNDVQAIEDNPDYTDEAKARKILALGDAVVESWGKARKAVEDAFDADRADLEAKASGAGRTAELKDTQTELRAMRSELAARDTLDSGHPGTIIASYQQAREDGDEAAMGVYERRGPGALTALGVPLSEVQRFEDVKRQSIEARMTPEQRQSRNELAAFDKRRGSTETGLSMLQDTLLNRVRSRNDFYRYGGKNAS